MPRKGQFKTHCKRGHERKPSTIEPNSRSCKLCRKILTKEWETNNRERALKLHRDAEKRRRDRLGKDKFRKDKLRTVYGLSEDDFNTLLAKQDGKCAICKLIFTLEFTPGSQTMPCVDHCHKQNKVRGLLCCKCNQAIGQFRDSIDNCLSAADYLKRHEKEGQ